MGNPVFQKVTVISVGKPFQENPSADQWTIVIEILFNNVIKTITLRQVCSSEIITAYFDDQHICAAIIESKSICNLEVGDEIELDIAIQ